MHDRPVRPTAFCWNQKYPRICGEKPALEAEHSSFTGSPPHMRGKGGAGCAGGGHEGITPAYAGKSRAKKAVAAVRRDHPRVCGEKAATLARMSLWAGSPPHMRGKGNDRGAVAFQHRITPAYAGKRRQQDRRIRPCRDHPRICGEKMSRKPGLGDKWGSPPHMRGKGYEEEVKVAVTGITPAYAGKSQGR